MRTLDGTRRHDDLDILLIDDDADDRVLVRDVLAEICLGDLGRGRCRLQDATTLAGGLALLRNASFDVILLDLHLPDAVGLEALPQVMAVQSVAPVLILTGLHDEATGFAAVQKGAQDFLAKSHLDAALLGRAIRYAIERHRMRREVSMKARELTASEDRLQRLIASSADGIII